MMEEQASGTHPDRADDSSGPDVGAPPVGAAARPPTRLEHLEQPPALSLNAQAAVISRAMEIKREQGFLTLDDTLRHLEALIEAEEHCCAQGEERHG